ncbi:MAG: acyltransferase [Veillonellales bacterium]
MSKQRVIAIEYIRGISMLGVVGIHTGAYSLTNPLVNVHLFALFDIFTRFSVPIFFFVSAFGLFFNHKLEESLDYLSFMQRRLRTVLLPYLSWSFLYMIHYTLISGDNSIWHPVLLLKYFIFGLASYQLYFLVILLWFYALMPCWRSILRYIIKNPIRNLAILLAIQIVFNYYSSYLLRPIFSNHYLNLAIQYRLSYWVIHYVFIFLLGAICALKYQDFKLFLDRYHRTTILFFGLTLAGMLLFYYYLLYHLGYTPEEAVNTDHQLSPIGVLYTLAASLFWFLLFCKSDLPQAVKSILNQLGKHSYIVYLVHPLFMYYLASCLTGHGIIMTAAVTIFFYLITVCLSLFFALMVQKVSKSIPILSTILIGSRLQTKKSG